MVFDRFSYLYYKLFASGNESPRFIIYKEYLSGFLQSPRLFVFGGMSKSIGGHNFIISAISVLGLLGLAILMSCYSIAFSQITKRINFKLSDLNVIELYALILSLSTLFVGNFVNDAITQPFNTIVMFIFLILFISIIDRKNKFLKIAERN